MAKKAHRDRAGPGLGPATQALASKDPGSPVMVTSKQRESTGNGMESSPGASKLTKRASSSSGDAVQGPRKAARAALAEAGDAGPSKEGGVSRDKPSDEIDDLFGKLKASVQAKPKPGLEKEEGGAPTAPLLGNKNDLFGTEQLKGRHRTEEGYAIYTEDELGFGRKNAGGTDLCPFDCQCCF